MDIYIYFIYNYIEPDLVSTTSVTYDCAGRLLRVTLGHMFEGVTDLSEVYNQAKSIIRGEETHSG